MRLQFIPQHPYAHSALNFTSRIPVQYKIQRRQLRVQHPDDHFCAAQLKYLNEKAVEMRENVAFFKKAKVDKKDEVRKTVMAAGSRKNVYRVLPTTTI